MQDYGNWRVIGDAVAGAHHRQRGLPCQDALYWELLPNGALALAVADGAGSASHAEIGAFLTVHAAVDAVARSCAEHGLPQDMAWHELARTAFREALAAVNSEADARIIPARELASTLILVIAHRQGIAAAQVGDGAAVAEVDGAIILLTAPQSGEYLNETTFLTSPGAIETAQIHVLLGRVNHVALFTDGLQHLALTLPHCRPHAPFFLPLFRFLENRPDPTEAGSELRAFLSSARVQEKTDDDVSLALASFVSDTISDAETSSR